jgi:hypothetical protein
MRSRPGGPMSALGQKQTSRPETSMSALPPKADIRQRGLHVRFVPEADIRSALFDHFVGEGQEILGQLNACALCRLEIDH